MTNVNARSSHSFGLTSIIHTIFFLFRPAFSYCSADYLGARDRAWIMHARIILSRAEITFKRRARKLVTAVLHDFFFFSHVRKFWFIAKARARGLLLSKFARSLTLRVGIERFLSRGTKRAWEIPGSKTSNFITDAKSAKAVWVTRFNVSCVVKPPRSDDDRLDHLDIILPVSRNYRGSIFPARLAPTSPDRWLVTVSELM